MTGIYTTFEYAQLDVFFICESGRYESESCRFALGHGGLGCYF